MKNLIILLPFTLILAACGGGSGGSSSDNNDGQPQLPHENNSAVWFHHQNGNTCVQQEALNHDHQNALSSGGFTLGSCSTDSFLGMCIYNTFINSSETLSARTIYYPGYLNSQELDDQLTVQLESSCNFLNGNFTAGNSNSTPSTGGDNFVPVTTISSNNYQNFFLKEGYAKILYSFEGQTSGSFYPANYSVRSLSNDTVTLNNQAHALFEITNDSGVRTIESINLATGATSQITQNTWSSNECAELVQGVIAVWTPLDQSSTCSSSELDTTKTQYLVAISDTDTDQAKVTPHAFALVNTFGLTIIKSDDNIYGVFARSNAGNYSKNNYYELSSNQGVALNLPFMPGFDSISEDSIKVVSDTEILIIIDGRIVKNSVTGLTLGTVSQEITSSFDNNSRLSLPDFISLGDIDFLEFSDGKYNYLYQINENHTYSKKVKLDKVSFPTWHKVSNYFVRSYLNYNDNLTYLDYFEEITGNYSNSHSHTKNITTPYDQFNLGSSIVFVNSDDYFFANENGNVDIITTFLKDDVLLFAYDNNKASNSNNSGKLFSLSESAGATWLNTVVLGDTYAEVTALSPISSPSSTLESLRSNVNRELNIGMLTGDKIYLELGYSAYFGTTNPVSIESGSTNL